MSKFKELNLNEKIQNALENKGYTDPTPIQAQSIPHVLEGRDLLGIAQTGTGKTAAFSLPILQRLYESNISVKSGCVRALILTPTRELALQIADNMELYGKDLGLRHAVIFGGVGERPQIAAMQRGVDILIATPGRLLDLTDQGYIRYMQLEVLVLDEADRMLDMGFINDIKKIIKKIPENRQTLFFSATMPDTISDLAHSILKNPVRVEVTPASTTVERIEQKVLFVEKSNKPSLLKTILKREDMKNALVFCKTKHGANKVVEHLERHGIRAEVIHGNKSQNLRQKALESFRSGTAQVLVATDIAARGIDVPGISHVINYDIPMDPESYVHRIGRTARAGKEGVAISFCDSSERKLLAEVEKTIKYKIPVDDSHPYHGVASAPTGGGNFEADHRHKPTPRALPRRDFDAPRGNRNSFNRDDERRALPARRDDARKNPRFEKGPENRRPKEGKKEKKKLFGIFDFGRTKAEKSESERVEARFGKKNEKKSFGFGWFKKKEGEKNSHGKRADGRSPNRNRNRDERSERGNAREVDGNRRDRSGAGFGERRRPGSSSFSGSGSRGGRGSRRPSRNGNGLSGNKW